MFGIRDAEMMREVVRSGGFRAAAQTMGLSQSAVSGRISALEKRLGVLLFDRSTRRAALTLEGRRFLEEAERLVALRDRIAHSFTTRAAMAGTLRLGVAETIVHTRLPLVLRSLRETAPGLRIELAVETSDNLAARLVAEDLDVAILLRQFVPPNATAHPVGRFDLGWYAAPNLPRGTGPIGLTELAGWQIVTFSRGTPPYREVERLFEHPDIAPPLLHGSASLATVLALVADGTGVGTLPADMAREALARGTIVRLDVAPELMPSALEFSLCHIRDHAALLAPIVERLDRADG